MYDLWLLEPGVRARMEQAYERGVVPTESQRVAFDALFARAESDGPRIMSIVGTVARVDIQGVMTRRPNWIAQIFGGGNTTYSDIIAAVRSADANDAVKSIDLVFDTPGGAVDGMFEAMEEIAKAEKPVRAVVANMAASAGYGLASQADEIVAASPSATIGSIGVVARFMVNPDIVAITSTEAPDKAPDVSTDEGKAVIRKHLDDLHALFVGGIAKGRSAATGEKITAKVVNSDFGRGAVYLAAEALKNNMIDSISDTGAASDKGSEASVANETTADGGKSTEVTKMTLEELQAKHPDVYKAAVQTGVDQERDRVTGHLICGENCDAMDIAVKAIKDGSGMTNALNAQYLTATRNKVDVDARGEDEDELKKAADKPGNEAKLDEDALADAVCAELGFVDDGKGA